MNEKDFVYLPLGGVGHIGMNISLYHYGGYWVMVDCGAGFADDDMPGIDMIIPNINYICDNCKNFLGIVLTHAHEDHYGAIPHIWRKLECPIYGSPFAAAVLRAKFREFNLGEGFIHEVKLNTKFTLEPFKFELISMAHSIPEMSALLITTDNGSVFHSGDWKFDSQPIVGEDANKNRLEKVGKEGVLAMVCDSTNVFSEGKSGSESELYDSMYEIVSSKKAVVAVTLFASNVARIKTICEVARANGREVAVFGRALDRIISAAKEVGYLQDIDFINEEEVSSRQRDKVLLLCTGCQGDLMAATNRLANNTHRFFELKRGDTIIFSSKIIPGNEKRIFKMLNRLTKMGVEIITEKDHKVHVSGHPYRDELKEMYQLIKPKISIPVHGEHMHIAEHAKLAVECGVKQALIISDGDMIKLNENSAERIDKIETSFFGLDGNLLKAPDSEAMKQRRIMRDNGVIIVILVVDSQNDLVKVPNVIAPGLLENKKFLQRLGKEVENSLLDTKISDYRATIKVVREIIRNALKRNRKKPYINVQIERIS